MYVLGIDTSNYATSIAVYCTSTGQIIYDDKQFLPVKKGELGLRQSDAVFHHTVALPQMLQKMRNFLVDKQIGLVGVSKTPRSVEGSYMPCFLVGVSAATALCTGATIKMVETSHQQGHITAAVYATGDMSMYEKQKLVFHVSGGTTELLLCEGFDNAVKIGGTTDLFAGQAVDRIGVKLGLHFPAGAALSELATKCDEKISVSVSVKGTDCSFSGLENKCNKLIEDGKEKEYVAKYCLLHVAKTILKLLENAKANHGNLPVLCAGGVMGSDIIKKYIQHRMKNVYFVQSKFASDNAIGVAVFAARKLESRNSNTF